MSLCRHLIRYLLLAMTAGIGLPAANADPRLPDALGPGDFPEVSDALIELGRALFFDPLLSGNGNISCAGCHHPMLATGDGLSLPIGEGGAGFGPTRSLGQGAERIHERVPRNSPALFNLGARRITRLFHDGRIEPDASLPSGIRSPAGALLPDGLHSLLAAQALFPLTSGAEMAGQPGENPQADLAAAGDLVGIWSLVVNRIRATPGYLPLFQAAFPTRVRHLQDIRIADLGNAIAAFETRAFRADNSPFDRFLRGERHALSLGAFMGMRLFYGSAGCARCHTGALQTDNGFHAIAMPQLGPGKGQGPSAHEDFGRSAVTGQPADRYRFRTPTLRNVALTAPYGHSGAYATLSAVIDHHSDPQGALDRYDPAQVRMPADPALAESDWLVLSDPVARAALADASELRPRRLRAWEKAALIDFLNALTDPASLDLLGEIPAAVPSGLPLHR